MPLRLAPWKSGVHRNAAISLFRALIRRSRNAIDDQEVQTSFRNFVHHKFRQHRNVTSKHILRRAFEEGYEAVKTLDDSLDGNEAALARINESIACTPAGLKQHPASRLTPQSIKPVQPPPPPRDAAYSILARPRPQVPGKRHIPVFVSAGGYPMLRIKKPQPASLSGYLGQRMRVHQRRVDAVRSLEEHWIPLAQEETVWDSIVGAVGAGNAPYDNEEAYRTRPRSWTYDLIRVKTFLSQQIANEEAKKHEMTKKMQEIVLRETDLAREEAEASRKQQRAAARELDISEAPLRATIPIAASDD